MSARPCEICGKPMLLRQRHAHAVCAGWGADAGERAGNGVMPRKWDLDGLARAFPEQAEAIRLSRESGIPLPFDAQPDDAQLDLFGGAA